MRKIFFTLLAVLVIVCLLNFGCKKTAGGTHTLTVVKGDGINGFPEAGTYTHEQDATVFYNYELFGAYTNLKLMIDDQEAPLNGSVTMDRSHTLHISSDRINFSGNWKSTFKWVSHLGGMCGAQDDIRDQDVVITNSEDSLTISINNGELELKGGLYGDRFYSVECEKRPYADYLVEYKVSGQFVTSTQFNGVMTITGYEVDGGVKSTPTCGSSSEFIGIKR